MAKKYEVQIGGYLADAELKNGEIVIRITGADINERLFQKILEDGHKIILKAELV